MQTAERMATSLNCLPCFIRQTLEAARMVSDDPEIHERIVREALGLINAMSLETPPASFARNLHRKIREIAGREDPYREVKDRQNSLALALLPGLRNKIEAAPDPLILAARLAVAGNVIDLGAPGEISDASVREAVDEALAQPLVGEGNGFREEILSAGKILYLADNAGEIVFDRLFIERLGPSRVTVAVRGGPILNDATRIDARAAGLEELVTIVDNGSDAPGTLLEDCRPEFRKRFAEADLVLAKGQGNYETLSRQPQKIFFLFKVKCPVIAGAAGASVGAHVVVRSRTEAAKEEP